MKAGWNKLHPAPQLLEVIFMPIYCYKCFDCNHYEEIKQKMDDEPLTKCPACGGNFKRVIRNVGIIFKGPGFHVTDYSRKNTLTSPPKPATTDKTEKSKKESSSETSSKDTPGKKEDK